MPTIDFVPPDGSQQKAFRLFLRGVTRLLFRGLMRPPIPLAGQRLLIGLLTAHSPLPRGMTRVQGELAGRPCEWHCSHKSEDSVLLYLHGGAFLLGSPKTHRRICTALAQGMGMNVCALDYRLTPEHPFPAARDDVVDAYRVLLEQGYSPDRIVIAGDSAGGNLTLVGTLRIRELGLPLPAALVCFSPATDFTGEHLHDPAAGDPLIHPKLLEQAVMFYRPQDMALDDPELSPVYADLSGLPPLLLQVAEDELLRNDSLRLAERAETAGVQVELEHYPGLWHVFQLYTGKLHAADYALERVCRFLRAQGL